MNASRRSMLITTSRTVQTGSVWNRRNRWSNRSQIATRLTGQRARTNDITMYYDIHGAGEPLVLIVGLATNILEWEGMISWLAKTNMGDHCGR